MQPLAGAMAGSRDVSSLSLADPCLSHGENGEISAYARTVSLCLDKLGRPAVVIGWSTGAIAAIEAAARYPEKIAGLVLLSATARFCLTGEYTAGVDPAVLQVMIRGLKRNPEGVIADFISQALYPVTIPARELTRRTQKALEHGTNSLIDGLQYLERVDLREALPAIAAPCFLIHGKQDRIVPWQAAQYLGSKLPAANVEFLPSAGHSLIEQCGKDLINRIEQFVGSLR
jgi:pimeloyl-[acyl-carrier protein] methyl ester esterase